MKAQTMWLWSCLFFAPKIRSSEHTKHRIKMVWPAVFWLLFYADILKLVQEGEISSAIAAINRNYPNLFARNVALHFRLLCQQFVEMITGKDDGHARAPVTPLQAPSSVQHEQSGSSSTGVSNGRGGEGAAPATNGQPEITNGDHHEESSISDCTSIGEEGREVGHVIEEGTSHDEPMDESGPSSSSVNGGNVSPPPKSPHNGAQSGEQQSSQINGRPPVNGHTSKDAENGGQCLCLSVCLFVWLAVYSIGQWNEDKKTRTFFDKFCEHSSCWSTYLLLYCESGYQIIDGLTFLCVLHIASTPTLDTSMVTWPETYSVHAVKLT